MAVTGLGGKLLGRYVVAIEGVRVLSAGPGFLTTMQIPLLAGREIDGRDQPGSPAVAVVSQRLAHTYFPNHNPLGRRLTLVNDKRDVEIVGVSGDLRYGSLKNEEAAEPSLAMATVPEA